MQQIIKNKQIVSDDWQLIRDVNFSDLPKSGKIIVPLALWLEFKAQLILRQNCGVWLAAGEEVSQISEDLTYLDLIALDFPQFSDGRHYSSAAILRQVYAFKGEIRAIGDVLKDQLQAMSRVGFNSFMVRSDKDLNDALQGLNSLPIFAA